MAAMAGKSPTETNALALRVRHGTKEDWPFVFASMLNGLYESEQPRQRKLTGDESFELIPPRVASPLSTCVGKDVFMREYHAVIESLLERATLSVAEGLASAVRPILGYLLHEPGVLHFAHVKREFRRAGVFRALLQGTNPSDCEASHFRWDSEWLFRKWPKLCYNPFRAWPRESTWLNSKQ